MSPIHYAHILYYNTVEYLLLDTPKLYLSVQEFPCS